MYVPVTLSQKERQSWQDSDRWNVRSLIVEPTRKTKGEYRRLGVFELYMGHKHILQGLQDSQAAEGIAHVEDRGVNEFGYRRWKISLV
jgi:hypothetical protein